MTISRQPPRLLSRPIALAVVTACISTLAAAQQPAQPAPPRQPDPAALEVVTFERAGEAPAGVAGLLRQAQA